MRTVQTVLDFFLETPQAYFCDRCGECHRAGECKTVEEPTQREPMAEEKTAPREPKEVTTPRKPKEKRKRRIQKKEKKRRKVKGVLTEPADSAGPRQGSAAWSKDRYIRDDEDQA